VACVCGCSWLLFKLNAANHGIVGLVCLDVMISLLADVIELSSEGLSSRHRLLTLTKAKEIVEV
jgi:hypothetical protein